MFKILRCEEVVVNCQLMGSEVGEGGSCCEQYFDREPFFDANSGTCYEGDFMLTPVEAMRMQRLRFWLRIDRNDLFGDERSCKKSLFS